MHSDSNFRAVDFNDYVNSFIVKNVNRLIFNSVGRAVSITGQKLYCVPVMSVFVLCTEDSLSENVTALLCLCEWLRLIFHVSRWTFSN